METPDKQNIADRKCRSCGAQVPSESKFCLKCGHELIDEKIPLAKTPTKSKLVRSLPWTLPLVLALLFFLIRPLFLTKGSDAQNSIAIGIFFLGSMALVTGVIGLLIQLVRRKGKRVWVSIALCSLAAVFIGMSIGDYVNISSSDKGSPSASPASTTPTTSATAYPTATGGKVELTRQTVPATGGTITINKPGDALNGLQLTVPAGAYKTATNFTVSYQNVKSANPDFTMAAPLISVDNGGGFSDQTMTLKVPIKYSGDDSPMLYYIDIATGEMEGIPTIGADATSITVAINHFSDIAAMSSKTRFLQEQAKNGVITTSFVPGQDDWSFENSGTFLSSNGNCAGMSLSAIWYFEFVSKGKTNRLYTQYPGDNKQIHEDDRDAWRLVSLVQQDFDSRWLPASKEQKGALAKLGAYANSSAQGSEATYNAFLSAMSVSKQPQIVGMGGVDRETGEPVGHAMIVYGVNSTGLMVADPNLPGNTKRVIPYTGGKLGPYFTNPATPIPGRPNAGYKYEDFTYLGGGAVLPFQAIAARNTEVIKNPTAISPFPDYKLTVIDDQAKTYNIERDTFAIDKQKISLRIDPSSLGTAPLQMSLYRDKSWVNNGYQQKNFEIELKQGANLVGIYVQSQAKNSKYWDWADFKWVTITYTAPQAPAAPQVPPAPQLEVWGGRLNGTSRTEMSQTSGTWSVVEISFDFTINLTYTGTSKGTGSVGGAAVVRSTLTNPPNYNASITGGAVTNGASLDLTPPSSGTGPGSMSLSLKPGQPTIRFGSHSRDVYTWSDNPTLPLQCYGIILAIESHTPTSMSGTWRFYEPSHYVQASSPTYRFTLTRSK